MYLQADRGTLSCWISSKWMPFHLQCSETSSWLLVYHEWTKERTMTLIQTTNRLNLWRMFTQNPQNRRLNYDMQKHCKWCLYINRGLSTAAEKAGVRDSFESQQIIIIYGNDIEFFFFIRRVVTVIVVIAPAVAIFQFMRMMTSICESALFIGCLHVNKPTEN